MEIESSKKWNLTFLSELFEVKSSRRVHKSDWQTNGIPFYRAREVVKLSNFGEVENELFISQNLYDKFTKEKSIPKAGDILISAVGTLGQCYEVKPTDKFYFKDASVLWFDKKSDVYSKFVIYAFKTEFVSKQIQAQSKGATVGTLTINEARKIKIPLPPLPEQTRIVAKLDALFERIDKAIALLEGNIKRTGELMGAVLGEVFSNANHWETKPLKNLTSKIGSGSTPTGGHLAYKKEGISLIRSMNIYDEGFRGEGLAFIDDDQARKLSNVEIESGDVLLNITGASIARCCIVPYEVLPARVNQHVSIIRVFKNKLNPQFLHLFLVNPNQKNNLLNISGGGATREALTKAIIENLEIPIPIIEEQKKIVDYVHNLNKRLQEMKAAQTQKLHHLQALKSSLLDQAFRGEL